MENFMEQVAVNDLVYESNRKYGKDAGFEQLVASIREYGILEPILVRREEGGKYRVIAGRRRAEAAAEAGLKAVECIVRSDGADDEELALVENINRLEMHPLDEADIFRRMKDAGATVEYMAAYFARPVSAIYQRIRLAALKAPAREMLRQERLDIRGAVLLGGLGEADQAAFVEKHEGKAADQWTVQEYITRTKKCQLYPVVTAHAACGTCGERTRNADAGLFEDDERFDDVCLNPVCYGEAWDRAIGSAIREAAEEQGDAGKIAFDGSIPRHLYRGAAVTEFEGKPYEILTEKAYVLYSEKTNRKKGTYWRIWLPFGGTRIEVRRCAYEKRAAVQEREDKKRTESLVKGYGKETLSALGARMGEAPEALARELKKRNTYAYEVQSAIAKRVHRRVGELNLRREDRNYAAMYVRYRMKDEEDLKALKTHTGFKDVGDIGLEDAGQRLFHFLIRLIPLHRLAIPTLEDLADPEKEYRDTLFWEYAGMDEEAYRRVYLEEAGRVVAHLKNGGSAGDLDKADLPAAVFEPDEEETAGT
jgi:ParB/RepB/Spo0J family partition protein